MSATKIMARLWSTITDLLLLIKGTPVKTLEEIEMDLDVTEYHMRPYAEDDTGLLELMGLGGGQDKQELGQGSQGKQKK